MATHLRLAARITLLTGAGIFSMASAAHAQSAPVPEPATSDQANSDSLPDIVVTAQKRSESAQNVPIAITALDTEKIASTGVTGIADLRAAVPALNVTTAVAGFGLPRIRGIGATGQGAGIENPVAIYIDGVYVGSPFAVLQSLFDTKQVAVLKGPQGTLFGRNATGGLIQIQTQNPTFDWEGRGEIGYGNYKTMNGAAVVSGPLSDTIAFSLSGQVESRDKGYGKNLFTGRDVQTSDEWAARAKLLFKPTERTSLLLSADLNGRNATDPAFINFGRNTLGQDVPTQIRALGGDPERDIYADVDPKTRSRQWGISLTFDQDIGNVSFKSITAYRRSELSSLFDPDGTTNRSLVIDNRQLDKQFTQEFNLISKGSGPFQWVIGAYYMNDYAGLLPFSRTQGLAIAGTVGPAGRIDNVTRVKLDSYSAFAQGTFAFDAATHLTAGLRYTKDQRSFSGENILFNSITNATITAPYTPAKLDFGKLSWRLSLDHRFSPGLLVYASYNRGFRAGAFGPQIVNNAIPILQPEVVDAYEIGFKSDLFDRRVRLNMSAYYNNQSSVQVMQVVSGVQQIYNAKGARIYGIEGDLNISVSKNFSLYGGFSWANARYKSFTDAVISIPFPVASTFSTTQYTYQDSVSGATVANTTCLGVFVPPTITTQAARDAFYRSQLGGNCLLRGDASGNRLQNSPEWTFSVGGNLDIPTSIGKFSLASNLYYNGGYVGTPDERVVQPAFTTVAASLTWAVPGDKVYVKVWGRNLTDAFYRSQIGASNSGDNGYSGPPRTYGVSLGFKF